MPNFKWTAHAENDLTGNTFDGSGKVTDAPSREDAERGVKSYMRSTAGAVAHVDVTLTED